MNAVLLFETLGVLDKVRWQPLAKGPLTRIQKRQGQVLQVEVALPFCGTWIRDGAWSLDSFLASHKPIR